MKNFFASHQIHKEPNQTNQMQQTAFETYIEQANLETKPHQIEAVAWGLSKEKEGVICKDKTIYGGLIADEMGLGKTIQMIGIAVSNPKQTLLVLPRSLLEQWNNFIQKTTSFQVHLFHGPKKAKTLKELQMFDIVITTYGTIATKADKSGKSGKVSKTAKTNNLIHQINWQRPSI